jgi:PTS system galactitol-specific IIA component
MDFVKMIDEDLIFIHKDFHSKEEIIRFLSFKLFEKGIVKKSFTDAVIEREKKYPTGLYLGEINVAIPHTDIKHVIKSGITVATLNSPVMFYRMDNPDVKIPVHIVFLLAVSQPQEYVQFLSKLTRSFGKEEIVKSIYLQQNTDDVANILKNILKDGRMVHEKN